MAKYLIGYDLGSSSVKASLIEIATGKTTASAQSPAEEMPMLAMKPGWAEQDPDMWWEHIVASSLACIMKSGAKGEEVAGIGISYQMHGLVCVDKNQNVLRPSIIWCDSRAVEIGNEAFRQLGERYCLEHLLNSPGNFTASKLKWVKDYEPAVYDRIDKIMLPGDFIAMRLSGEIVTTASGLSEGMLWDYQKGTSSDRLLDLYGLILRFLPMLFPRFPFRASFKKVPPLF